MRCPPGGAHTGFVNARTQNRIASAESGRTGCLSSAGSRRRRLGAIRPGPAGRPVPIHFSVLATSGSIAATSTIMLALRGLLVIAVCRITAALPPVPAKAVYDQRQTGDLNVQIELKDLQVIALLKSELLDDYTVNPFANIPPF